MSTVCKQLADLLSCPFRGVFKGKNENLEDYNFFLSNKNIYNFYIQFCFHHIAVIQILLLFCYGAGQTK